MDCSNTDFKSRIKKTISKDWPLTIVFVLFIIVFIWHCFSDSFSCNLLTEVVFFIDLASMIAIIYMVLNFFWYETIDIEGIGRLRIKRDKYDIQSLTNFISQKYYRGDNFSRRNVLKAFYKDIDDDIELVEPAKAKPLDAMPHTIIFELENGRYSVKGDTGEIGFEPSSGQRIAIETAALDSNAIEKIEDLLITLNGNNLSMMCCDELYKVWYEYGFGSDDGDDAGIKDLFRFDYADRHLFVRKSKISSYAELTKVVFVAFAAKSLLSSELNCCSIGLKKNEKPTFILPNELAKQVIIQWYSK